MSRSTQMGSRATLRVDIDETIVEEALYLASIAKDSKKVHDYVDKKQQRYLVLRQRGYRVGWFVRAKGKMERIGNVRKEPGAPDFLDLRKARQKAGERYYAMRPRGGMKLPPGADWTWADLDREYQASLRQRRKKGHRIKPPTQGGQDDVRRCLNKPAFVAWRKIRTANLTPLHLIKLLNDVHAAHGHRAAEKAAAYVKAALNWALSHRTIESGLAGTMPWWAQIEAPEPTEDELREMEIRQQDLVAAKEAFTIEYLGQLLARHEQYCSGRQRNRKISPEVRWGLWWVALTANRRFTATKLRRCDLKQADPLNRYSSPYQPWGVAEWPAELVKNKIAFMLPIPPFGLHIANACTWDWRVLVSKKRGFRSGTQWVFASSRRQSRKGHPANPDPSIYPNSLDAHIRALRGEKRSGKNKTDHLAGIPRFWPHLVRSSMTNFFARHRRTLPAAAASAMLGHVLPNDNDLDLRRMSKTTEEYYLTGQHMDLKALAMKMWSEALLKAYAEAGGQLPMPYETDPERPKGPNWILPRFPV